MRFEMCQRWEWFLHSCGESFQSEIWGFPEFDGTDTIECGNDVIGTAHSRNPAVMRTRMGNAGQMSNVFLAGVMDVYRSAKLRRCVDANTTRQQTACTS